MGFFCLTVPENVQIQRVDKFLSQSEIITNNFDNTNRSHLKNIITNLSINNSVGKFSSKIKPGDVISFDWEEIIPEDISPEDIPLDIIFENEDVTVINKKQGIVTHPAVGNWSGTLVNALLFHWGKDAVKQTKSRPGIVHRLDKDTSGVIITAKNLIAENWLQQQFQNRRVGKEYIAIVVGRPPCYSGNIKTQIVRDSKNRKKFKAEIGTTNGKFAHTVYKCIACYGPFSLMRLKLKTGRTHQIRVHLKYLGCPILGDPIYGSKNNVFSDATLMLHSRSLLIRLPNSCEFSEFKADVPIRFKKVLRVLHEKYEKCVLKK